MKYLTEHEVKIINGIVIKKYSPGEDAGVKDPNALNVTIMQPKQVVFGKELYPTVFLKAAILFEMIVNKHCFYNGNKRTAIMALYVFLNLNGYVLKVENIELENMAVDLATKRGKEKIETSELAQWIEQRVSLK